jgi:hypothetical protein
VVWGVPDKILEVEGLPDGKRRFRFRSMSPGRVIVLTETGAREFVLENLGDRWRAAWETARNCSIPIPKSLFRRQLERWLRKIGIPIW